ncbi:hypothetical protein [Nocardioides terrisoli]|uniref:hypothetical protein n=1 Tax=Nocardioides terrisoli TaxID=3388267 RepID=UPI00287B61F7|nr:hypothetical protein [Nocardioides marmorisolisilvae]
MPRDATRTRELLVRAGERRFARDGVSGARLADIVGEAHQANDSAVGYHFGSREGLLRAIVDKHMAAMEDARAASMARLPNADLAEVVDLVVGPTAARLLSPSGRDFLRITEQLAGYSGVRAGRPALAISGTVLAAQLARLEEVLRDRLTRQAARERVGALVTFLTASLAERARSVEAGGRQRVAHQRFVDDLVAMLTAAMEARASVPAARAPR